MGGGYVGGYDGSGGLGGGGGGGGGIYGLSFNTASSFGPGGNGGSGVVIVRYPGAVAATGGSISSSGGYTYHTFTGSDTFRLT
jgi:hypothetical protein